MGLASVNGRGKIAESRLRRLNDWTVEQAEDYQALAFYLWLHRSKNNWRRDLTWLAEQGYPFKPRKKLVNRSRMQVPRGNG